MTTAEWKKVEEELHSLFGSVKLKCDDYMVTIALERYNQFKNVLAVYVNGEIKGSWYTEDCEERRRFFQPNMKSILSPKAKTSLKKLPKKMKADFENRSRYVFYSPYWRSFGSLKTHLIKNNKVIELIQEGE